MTLLLNVLIVVATFVAMEGVAWAAHRYLMHGPMWWFHHDHHNNEPGFFEKNDAFFLISAIPSSLLIYFGTMQGDYRLWIGVGIAIYGLCYVIVHDIFIHQRFRWLRRTNNVYLIAIRKAHLVHQRHLGPEDGECFGMLWAPPKYFLAARGTARARGAARTEST